MFFWSSEDFRGAGIEPKAGASENSLHLIESSSPNQVRLTGGSETPSVLHMTCLRASAKPHVHKSPSRPKTPALSHHLAHMFVAGVSIGHQARYDPLQPERNTASLIKECQSVISLFFFFLTKKQNKTKICLQSSMFHHVWADEQTGEEEKEQIITLHINILLKYVEYWKYSSIIN